jgi:hypothetical protein
MSEDCQDYDFENEVCLDENDQCYDEDGEVMECEAEEAADEPKDPSGQPLLWGLVSTANTLAPLISYYLAY